MGRRSKKISNIEDASGNTIDGTYSFEYDNDGKIIGITQHSPGGNVFTGGNKTPIDPGSDLFADLVNSDTALEQYNRMRFGGNRDAYFTSGTAPFANSEDLAQNFNENVAKFKNEQQLEAANNIENASTPSRAFDSYSNNRDRNTSALIHAYPLDIDPQQDHMFITKYKYFRPDEVPGKGNDARKSNASGSGADGGTGAPLLKSGLQLGQVILPMPKIQDTNGAEWGESKLNAAGVALVDAATTVGAGSLGTKGSQIDRLAKKRITNAVRKANNKRLKDQLAERRKAQKNRRNRAGLTDFGAELIAGQVANLASQTGITLSTNQFLARSSGRVLNPNAELLFGGPVLRDFSFDFTFVARSEAEGREIRKIIRFFKTGMMAKFLDTSSFLSTPDIFTLEYRRGKNILNTVNRFNETGLALRTMAVDYAPNGYWSAYRDSQPTSLKISLNFAELKPIYDQDQNNSPKDSVGF